ncbi:MAG: hypothetical protein K0R15_1004 [Clostridiales bacterium]|nr:hypothetical protein [Clostridiales bacterium]
MEGKGIIDIELIWIDILVDTLYTKYCTIKRKNYLSQKISVQPGR